MKIELTIKVDYLPSWSSYEGARELLQNGQDAQTELGAPLTVRHRKESDTLVIENEGCTLPYEALLLGHTSKVGRADLIGHWGEGMKLGILALVRAGHAVKIRSGSEVWIPSIQRSEKFKADVLVFDISKGRKEENRVAIEIGSIDAGAWSKMKDCFLFLGVYKDDEVIKTSFGSLLLGERFKGRIFVKGIFVENDPRLSFGYDLTDASIDRDRKMVSKYDLQFRTSNIWREAMARRPDLIDDFGKLLEKEAADVAGVDDWQASILSDNVKKVIAEGFVKRHGEAAIPVATLGDSQDVEHLGKKGVVVPKSFRHVLEQKLGTAEKNKTKLREEATNRYGWHDLNVAEKASLERAIAMINAVKPTSINEIDIVDFRDPKLQGMFRSGDGEARILIAKKHLADRDLTLCILVHEVAHRVGGGDGEKDHVSNIEHIWSGIVANLTGKTAN